MNPEAAVRLRRASGPVVATTGGVRTVAQAESKAQIDRHKKSKEAFITPNGQREPREAAASDTATKSQR